jgi:hypothetical protein
MADVANQVSGDRGREAIDAAAAALELTRVQQARVKALGDVYEVAVAELGRLTAEASALVDAAKDASR